MFSSGTTSCSVNSFQLILLDEWVLFDQFLLLGAEVVERALVRLSMSVFGAVDVATLAGNLDETHFLAAVPALVRIGLYKLILLVYSIFVKSLPQFFGKQDGLCQSIRLVGWGADRETFFTYLSLGCIIGFALFDRRGLRHGGNLSDWFLLLGR